MFYYHEVSNRQTVHEWKGGTPEQIARDEFAWEKSASDPESPNCFYSFDSAEEDGLVEPGHVVLGFDKDGVQREAYLYITPEEVVTLENGPDSKVLQLYQVASLVAKLDTDALEAETLRTLSEAATEALRDDSGELRDNRVNKALEQLKARQAEAEASPSLGM